MSELPKGWSYVTYDDVATYTDYVANGSFAALKEHVHYKDEEDYAILVRLADETKKWRGPFKYVSKDAYDFLSKSSLVPGDLFLVNVGAPGKAFIVPDLKKPMTIAPNGVRVRVKGFCINKYLYYYILSPDGQAGLNEITSGNAQQKFNKTLLKKVRVPLAPINEQKRIADKLDSILAKVDRAQARLDKIPGILKRFRQSVLAAATSGELTREWRGGGDHNWPNVALGTVGKAFNYGSSAKSQPEGDVPVLRMGNLQGGKLDWDDLVYTSDKDEIDKYLLEDGDVLFNRTNSPELVGKTSIYRGERKAIYAGYLIRIKGSERLNTEFLNIQLNSPHARDYCWQVKTDGVSQSNINAKKLQAYEFDLPEMEEQLEIVRRVGELFSHAMLFERQYIESKRRFDRLSQSVLAKAFRGELADQNPSDEPADILLDRIKQQQREAPKSTRQTRKPAAKVIPSVDVVETDVELTPPESEILALLKNTSGELSAQQIVEQLTEKTFEQIDALFSELKRLLDNNSIVKVGSGEACTFKAIKR